MKQKYIYSDDAVREGLKRIIVTASNYDKSVELLIDEWCAVTRSDDFKCKCAIDFIDEVENCNLEFFKKFVKRRWENISSNLKEDLKNKIRAKEHKSSIYQTRKSKHIISKENDHCESDLTR